MSEMNSMGLLGPIMADEDNLKVEKAEQSETVVNKKVEIPQCAIDVIENAKEKGHSLYKAMDIFGKTKTFCDWIDLPANQEIFARAWIDGYKVEEEEGKEKRYLVKLKATNQYLHVDSFNKASFLPLSISSFGTEVTKTMLDDLGLSEAFSNPLFEVEEVK